MVNKIKKKCPSCGCEDADILAALIMNNVSWNAYRCLTSGRRHSFLVKRKGDKKEQELTENYIKSDAIKLKDV